MKLKHLFTPSRTKSTVLLASTILTLTPVTFITSSMPVYATEADTIEVDATETKETQFFFRNIPWYSTKKETEKILTDGGAKIQTAVFKDNILRMDGINYTNIISGTDRVDGGGIVGRYSGINVAGYDVSDTCACYIYSIDENGIIDKSEDNAQFYFGWYTFDSNDYVDGEAVYNDLLQKLSSLYGTGTSNTEDDYFSTTTWHDSSDNQIRLLIGAKNEDYTYVTLGYMVSDADERLDEMQVALDNEAIANEAEKRKSSKDNVSGL